MLLETIESNRACLLEKVGPEIIADELRENTYMRIRSLDDWRQMMG